MDANTCCPYCSSPVAICPHLLIVMGSPGEVHGGALAERLRRLWQLVIDHVGDDPRQDCRGAYRDTWFQLRGNYAVGADLAIEGDEWTAIFVADPCRMDCVVESCIPLDEL
jgi:hypothetical protein